MRIGHMGYGIRGFYRIAKLGYLCCMTPKDAQRRLQILRFWDKHGLAATVDAFEVSRRTLYRWKKALHEAGGNPTALSPKSCAPKRRRKPVRDPRLVAEIRSLRRIHPNLGKDKLHVLLKPWCERQGIALPSASTLGRIIARAPDRMRYAPARIDRLGRAKPLRGSFKPRKPKGARLAPMEVLAADTIERILRVASPLHHYPHGSRLTLRFRLGIYHQARPPKPPSLRACAFASATKAQNLALG